MGLLVVSSDAGLGWLLLVASRGREGPGKGLVLQVCFVLKWKMLQVTCGYIFFK